MRQAGEERPGAMAAILGELAISIDALCARASAEAGEVVPANYNTAEQTVVSGEVAGVERAMTLAKENGAKRAVRLPVSGAFHSPLMRTSEAGLREALQSADLTDPRVPVYSNVDAEPCTTAAAARDRLLRQLTAPVRWMELVGRLGRLDIRAPRSSKWGPAPCSRGSSNGSLPVWRRQRAAPPRKSNTFCRRSGR